MMVETSKGLAEPLISALVNRSLASFKALTLVIQYNHSQTSQVNACLARFKLWTGNLGAHRSSGRRSLEYRLRDASHIRKLVISLLQDLCASIEQGILIATGDSDPDTTSQGHDSVENDLADYFNDDEDSNKSETEKVLDEVSHVIACLLRLSVTIRNPAPHDQFLSRVDEGLVESFMHWDAKHVRDKFHNVNEDLAERLGRAMARRRLYFKYRKEHKDRLAEGLDEVEAELGEMATTIASSLPEHLKRTGEVTETCLGQSVMLDDSRSDASGTSYATSSPESTQLRVPPIPKEYIYGPFKCPFCQMMVSIETRYAWKKHVFRDLRPYVCLTETCKTPEYIYLSRKDWIMHMKREHWKTWHCPFGCDAGFDRADDLQGHVKRAHKHDLSPEKIYALDDLSSHSDLAKAKGQCPLCCDFQMDSEKQYEKHVGQHLEQFALFTLPGIEEEGNEDNEGHARKEGEQLSDEDEDDEDQDDENEEYWFDKHDPGSKALETQQQKTQGILLEREVRRRKELAGPSKSFHCCCGYSANRRDNHMRHIRACTVLSSTDPFICNQGHTFWDKTAYMFHLQDAKNGCGRPRRGRPPPIPKPPTGGHGTFQNDKMGILDGFDPM